MTSGANESYGWPGPAPTGSTVTLALVAGAPGRARGRGGPAPTGSTVTLALVAGPTALARISVCPSRVTLETVETPERPPPRSTCWPAAKPSATNEPPSVRVTDEPAVVTLPLKLGPVSVI